MTGMIVKIRKILIVAVLIVIGLPVALLMITVVSINILDRSNCTLLSSGEEREYLLYVPSSYDGATPTPLVISMHGGASWPAHQKNLSRWNRLADEHGFIVVYPSGTSEIAVIDVPKIWGIDRAAGTKEWRYVPAAEEMDDGTSDVVFTGGIFSVGADASQALVLEAFSEPGAVKFSIISLADGSPEGQSEYAVDEDVSTYWIEVLGWNSGRAYLVLDGSFRTLDYMTGQETGVWP